MKKIILASSLLIATYAKSQTYVTIPDTAFVTWLQSNFPSAMSGNQLDITNSTVTSAQTLAIQNRPIKDLTGVQYFTSLKDLNCGANQLKRLPVMPSSVTSIECDGNRIDSIFTLPPSLQQLTCSQNPLKSIASFPSSLTSIDCDTDSLTSLPALPASMTSLICRANQITSLPALPSSLNGLDCSYNKLTSLPSLPGSLGGLECSYNLLTALPVLNSSLQSLSCGANPLGSLPVLPAGLQTLACGSAGLTSLPALPGALRYLYCNNNNLTSLPTLPTTTFWILDCSYNPLVSLPAMPGTLTTLYCYHDSLTTIPSMPVSVTELRCQYNKITCFPTFLNMLVILDISHNPNTCLPNYVNAMDSATKTTPLCGYGNPNGCPVADTCTPNLTFYLSQDSFSVSTWDIFPVYSLNTTSAIWYWGDGTSSTGFYPSHVYASGGTYNICATVFSACGDSSQVCQADSFFRVSSAQNMVYVNVQGGSSTGIIANAINARESVYPNPGDGTFKISIEEPAVSAGTAEIIVTNSIGQEVYTGTGSFSENKLVKEINLHGYGSGMYFISIKCGIKSYRLKAVVR